MHKVITFLIITSIVASLVSAAYVCQDEQDDDKIPCEIVSPSIAGDCVVGGYNITITSLNTSIQTNFTMAAVGDGTYNVSFNFSNVGESFSLVLCENSSATIEIVEEDDEDVNLWIMLFLILAGLIVSGVYFRTDYLVGDVFLFAGGTLSLLMGIWVFNDGISFYTVSYWWVYPFAWILVGTGIILTVVSGLSMIKDFGGEK